MEVQIKEAAPGQWVIKLVSSVGIEAGRTIYPTAEAAEAVARIRHPDKEIKIIR